MGGEEEQLSHLYFLMEKAEFFEQRKMEYFNKAAGSSWWERPAAFAQS